MCTDTDTDTRERPKKQLKFRATTRLPKTRTKTGCFTCRKRKKKCDEKTPICSGCSRNLLMCVWPSYATETLPKDFKISACMYDHFEDTNNTNRKKDIENAIPTQTETVEDDISTIPSNFCSLMEIKSYKHEIPFPLTTTYPDSIDFLVDSIFYKKAGTNSPQSDLDSNISKSSCSHLTPSLEESYVDHHLISEMFDSIYSEPIGNIALNSFSPEESIYSDLLNYSPKTKIISVSIKNPMLAAFREIFFAHGCAFLANNHNNNNNNNATENGHFDMAAKYNAAANKHYNNSINIISDNAGTFKQYKHSVDSIEHWSVFSIKTLCKADKLLGLVTENCISNLISVEDSMSNDDINCTLNGLTNSLDKNFDQILFSQVLFTYPFLIYFSDFNSLLEILPPNKLFQNYNKEMVEIFLDSNGNDNKEEESYQSPKWLENVLKTAIINVFQNLTKLMWLLRTKNSIEIEQFNSNLKTLKTDISLIWTTIQTAEIQLDMSNSLIDFAKLSHMSLEILFLAISDTTVCAKSPIIGYYLDQFMGSYESYLRNNNGFNNDTKPKVAKCFFILPLFIVACSAQSLYQKEFISKELYILSRDLGLDFVEQLTFAIEDAWCSEQNLGSKTFSKLVSREGFSNLARTT